MQEDSGVDSPAARSADSVHSAKKKDDTGGYDAIVVGAGVAGSALAYRLAKVREAPVCMHRDSMPAGSSSLEIQRWTVKSPLT